VGGGGASIVTRDRRRDVRRWIVTRDRRRHVRRWIVVGRRLPASVSQAADFDA